MQTWKSLTLLCIVAAMASLVANAVPPAPIPLWAGGAPDAVGTGEADTPTITPYIAPKYKSSGAAIVVCPGGGYAALAMDHEGLQIAKWLNAQGISAFILRYRHAPEYDHPAPLNDAQRALRTVRAKAAEWGVNPSRLGIMGFSAGGHLAATASTQFTTGDPASKDPVEQMSSRPDFTILLYPVITLEDPFAHVGSRMNLLGTSPTPEMIEQLSADKRVTPETPPAFLVHTTEDTAVPPENSIYYYLAMHEAGVPVELHVYEKGQHGLGLAPGNPIFATWANHCLEWLRGRSMIK